MFAKVMFIGNLGRDPEMRYSPSGQAVTNFSVATTEKWTGSDGQLNERTTWWRVSAWGKLAESCNQYLRKGRQVFVEGRMNCDPKTGGPRIFQRQDGTYGAAFEVTAYTVQFLGSKSQNGDDNGGDETEPGFASGADDDDQIPF